MSLFHEASRTGQANELHRLFSLETPTPIAESPREILLRHIPDGIEGVPRITKVPSIPRDPMVLSLVNERVQRFHFQRTVRRWTAAAGFALTVCAMRSGLVDHDTLLSVILWAMATACFLLYIRTSPDALEGK